MSNEMRVIGYNAHDTKHGLTVNELMAFTQALAETDIDGDTPITVNVKLNSRIKSIMADERNLR